ncbi:MAG: deoxyribodipyrimidine photolyase [Myxococcota bacterium]
MIPGSRLRVANERPLNPDGQFVLYWMIANRRPHDNYALQRAAEHAAEMGRPLVILEALRNRYRWASDRIHRFIIDGMRAHEQHFADRPVLYYPYVEPAIGHGAGMLEACANRACLIVTDEYPAFFLPRMVAAAAQKVSVRMEVVDSNGLIPLSATEAEKTTAHSFRRLMQKIIAPHLKPDQLPDPDPLNGMSLQRLGALDDAIAKRWPKTDLKTLDLSTLPIDHGVPEVPGVTGGFTAGEQIWSAFLDNRLERYNEDRNHPEKDGASGLSPYLHFGHISVHRMFRDITRHQGWSVGDLPQKATGKRAGWWQMSEPTEAFLDELITWRELGYHFCHHRPDDYDKFDSLPAWALKTLADHTDDDRQYTYTLQQFEQAKTHDALWNAAQHQLRAEGRIHNYLRMLWGKKILHWTASPRDALTIMEELNNKYGLDGRDPNSYSGIFWVLGRFDRAWGPERPIFGKVRYMTSDSTRRKYRVNQYIKHHTPR